MIDDLVLTNGYDVCLLRGRVPETNGHFLRLLFSSVYNRYPGNKIPMI